MARYLYRVFACVRVGGVKNAYEHLVNGLSLRTYNIAKGEGVSFSFFELFTLLSIAACGGYEDAVGYGYGLWSGNTNNADGTARGGGNGTYCIR